MADEALAELERIPEEERSHEDVEQLRVYILMRARRWPEALAACEALRTDRPELSLGYIHGAFCLHELGRTAEAMELLRVAFGIDGAFKKMALEDPDLDAIFGQTKADP